MAITLNLTEAKAEKFASLLEKVRAGSKGEERKVIDDLIESIDAQNKKKEDLKQHKQDIEDYGSIVESLLAPISKVLPVLKKRGLSKESVAYINALDGIFRDMEQRLETETKAHAKTLPPKDRPMAELPITKLDKTLNPIKGKIERLTEKFISGPKTRIPVSEKSPHVKTRAQLAKKCFETGLEIGDNATGDYDLSMSSLYVSDMNTHVKLGVALLGGNMQKIDDASNMDTACRDYLDEKVWNFIQTQVRTSVKPKRSFR